MIGIQIREVRAHRDVITSISKIQYADCSAIITSSKDFNVKTWSTGFDLWGTLNQKTNAMDPLWHMPTRQQNILRQNEIQSVEQVIDQIEELNLDYPRRKLMVEEKGEVIKQKTKVKTRANWFVLQEDARKKEQEMFKKKEKAEGEARFEKAKGELILKKIDGIISEQTLNYHLLQMDLPEKMPEGPLRNF